MLKKAGKRFVTILVLAAFCLTLLPPPAFAAQQEETPLEKIARVEKILYGMELEGSLVERTGKVEKDLFGLPDRLALMAKVERIYHYVWENSAASPSLVFKMNALEWSLTQSVAKGSIKSRLEGLERTVAGVIGAGSFDSRISRLMTITFSGSSLNTRTASLGKDSLIKIKLVTPLDSKKNKVGDPVEFEVAEDLYSDDHVILAKGLSGRGKVSKVEKARNFGRDAKLEVNFESVDAMDGKPLPTLLGDKAKKETLSMATAAGAGLAGMILLGPFGVVGAAFVHGKNVTVPAGTSLYIQTQADAELTGMTAK